MDIVRPSSAVRKVSIQSLKNVPATFACLLEKLFKKGKGKFLEKCRCKVWDYVETFIRQRPLLMSTKYSLVLLKLREEAFETC